MIPRRQILSFSVPEGGVHDLTAYTKYNHDKVRGVVLLPDRDVFGDKIFLEINHQTVLPEGFDAGLISFRQFLNRNIGDCSYYFDEYAKGSRIRIVYRNMGKGVVNLSLVLYTSTGDSGAIEKRKKLQIVPVPYTAKKDDGENGYEPCEVHAKTDFHCDELTGVFNDYFNFARRVYPTDTGGEYGELAAKFHEFFTTGTDTDDEMAEKMNSAKALAQELAAFSTEDETKAATLEAMIAYANGYVACAEYRLSVSSLKPKPEGDGPLQTSGADKYLILAEIVSDFEDLYFAGQLDSSSIAGLQSRIQALGSEAVDSVFGNALTMLFTFLGSYKAYIEDESGQVLPPSTDNISICLPIFKSKAGFIAEWDAFIAMPEDTPEEQKAKEDAARNMIGELLDGNPFKDYLNGYVEYLGSLLQLKPEADEPQLDVNVQVEISNCAEEVIEYDDDFQSLSTLRLNVGARPVYPDGYPVANIVPRYRKPYSKVMYRLSMPVKEDDIHILFRYRQTGQDDELSNTPRDFNMYFQYHQTVRT